MKAYTRAEAEDDLRDALEHNDLQAAFAACRAIDNTDPPGSLVTVLGAALWYADHGMPVFPVMPMDKRPYPGTRGVKDATTDREEVARLFAARTGCNVAIATGFVYDVIDVDGEAGNVTLTRELLDEPTIEDPFNGIPDLQGVVSTPRAGGRHLYVPASGRGNTAGMGGIDYRGLGGYVLVPPSLTAQGAYVWVRPLDLP